MIVLHLNLCIKKRKFINNITNYLTVSDNICMLQHKWRNHSHKNEGWLMLSKILLDSKNIIFD